jgi:type I restriction enzyme R subunit
MSALAGGKANELTFQNDMLKYMLADGWPLDKAWAA